MDNLATRIATFLFMVGAFLLLGFIASDAVATKDAPTKFWMLLIGLPITAWGIRGLWKGRSAPQKAERFRTVKRIFGRKKKSGDDGG